MVRRGEGDYHSVTREYVDIYSYDFFKQRENIRISNGTRMAVGKESTLLLSCFTSNNTRSFPLCVRNDSSNTIIGFPK